jgi:hypothetical protein
MFCCIPQCFVCCRTNSFWYHCASACMVLMFFPLCRAAVHLRLDHGVRGLSHLYELLGPLCVPVFFVLMLFPLCAELLCTYALITVFVDYLTFMNFWYHCVPVFFCAHAFPTVCRTAVHLRPDHGVRRLSHLHELLPLRPLPRHRADVHQDRPPTVGRQANHQDAAPGGDTELCRLQVSVPSFAHYFLSLNVWRLRQLNTVKEGGEGNGGGWGGGGGGDGVWER